MQVYDAWRQSALATSNQLAFLEQRAFDHWRLKHSARTWVAWRRALAVLKQESQLQLRQEEQWQKVQGWLRQHRAAEQAGLGNGAGGISLDAIPSFREHMGLDKGRGS
jgi:hypothetical protein